MLMNQHLPSSELVIRPALFSDIPFIQNIAYNTWPSAYGAILTQQQIDYMLNWFYSEKELEEQMKNQHLFFIALQNFIPVGFAAFSAISASISKLHKLYVIPSEQKTGAGKALLHTVEQVAQSKGATRLQLNVNRHNVAKSFYEKNRFSIVEEVNIDIGQGFFMNDYVMEKDL